MVRSPFFGFSILIFAVCGLGAPACAHTILSCAPAATNVPNTLGACIFATPFDDNDPVAPPAVTPNTGFLAKTFFDATIPFDVEFFPVPLAPGIHSTEYLISESVTNSSGLPWIDYHILIGSGTGSAFFPTAIADFDDPDGPFPSPFSSAFATATVVSPIELLFSGGIVAPGATVSFTYPIDVCCGFTLRQLPSLPAGVPEPATVLLLVPALLAIGFARRRPEGLIERAAR